MENLPCPEIISQGDRTLAEINGYKAKPPICVVVDRKETTFYGIKGGLNQKKGDNRGIAYEVLYGSNDTWLKIIPPEAKTASSHNFYETHTERLKISADIQRAAHRVAGLEHLAAGIIDREVIIRGESTYGFTSPHIGPSLEFILYLATGTRQPQPVPERLRELFEKSYLESFRLSAQLLKQNYWVDDPNPGNILFYNHEGVWKVTMIDFSNNRQLVSKTIKTDPPRENRNSDILGQLSQRFREQCRHLGIQFKPNIREFLT